MAVLPSEDEETGEGSAEQADAAKAQTDQGEQGDQAETKSETESETEDAAADPAPAKPSVPQTVAVQKDVDTVDDGQADMAQPLRAAANATSLQQVQDTHQSGDAVAALSAQVTTHAAAYAQADSPEVWHISFSETASAAVLEEQQVASAQALMAAVGDSAESQPLDEIAGCCCYYCYSGASDGGSDIYGDSATQANPSPGNTLIAGIVGPNKWDESSTPSLTWAMSDGSAAEWTHFTANGVSFTNKGSSATHQNLESGTGDGNNLVELRADIRYAFNLYEDISGLLFSESSGFTDNATDIKLMAFSDYDAFGRGEFPGNNPKATQTASEIFETFVHLGTLENSNGTSGNELAMSTDPEVGGGSNRLHTTMHEIMHALGFGHPHDGGNGTGTWTTDNNTGAGENVLDNDRYTIMSYERAGLEINNNSSAFGLAVTPMVLDFAGFFYLYGSSGHNSTNTTYTLTDPGATALDRDGSNGTVSIGRAFYAIHDTGGTDEIKYSGSKHALINLNNATLNQSSDPAHVTSIINTLNSSTYFNTLLPLATASELRNDLLLDDWHAGGFGSRVFNNFGVADIGGYYIVADLYATAAHQTNIEVGTGSSLGDILIGNENNNTLNGNAGDDLLIGSDGGDRLNAGTGDDELYGGTGGDTLEGDEGRDTLRGEAGNDWLQIYNSGSNDVVSGEIYDGGANYDVLQIFPSGSGTFNFRNTTVSGLERLYYDTQYTGTAVVSAQFTGSQWAFDNVTAETHTGAFITEIFLSSGQDIDLSGLTISGLSGINDGFRIYGSGGYEEIIGSSVRDTIEGGLSTDTINGGGGADRIYGNTQADPSGSTYADILSGGSGNDTILGANGNDTIEGGTGSDSLNGGGGTHDVLSYENSIAGVVVNLENNTAGGGDATGDSISNFEDFLGSSNNDTVYGGDLDSSIDGANGNDSLVGDGGQDTLRGGIGNDTLRPGNSSDHIVAGEIYDGGSGVDTLWVNGSAPHTKDFRNVTLTSLEQIVFRENGTPASGDLIAQMNVNQWTGSGFSEIFGYGHTTLDYILQLYMDTATTVDLSGVAISGFDTSGSDDYIYIIGDGSAETFTGSSIQDSIEGNDGNDTFVVAGSGSAFDTLRGGAGDDKILVSNTTDMSSTRVQLGSIEEIEFDYYSGLAAGSVLKLSLSVQETDSSTELSSTLLIDGANGAGRTQDVLEIVMDNAVSSLDMSGYGFNDWGLENDYVSVIGGTIFETIIGSVDRDSILGNGGNDLIEGGLGDDTLDGGTDGQDTVSYVNASGAVTVNLQSGVATGADGTDSISDFEVVLGSDHDDTFTSETGSTIHAGIGADTMFAIGLAGQTLSEGGSGNDTILAVNGYFVGDVDGGDNHDLFDARAQTAYGMRLDLAGGEHEVLGAGGPQVSSLLNFEDVAGTQLGDSITGNGLANVIDGDGGNDTISGGGGADAIFGGSGEDLIIWNDGDGDDAINGGLNDDTLRVNLNNGGDDVVSLQSNGSGMDVERFNGSLFTLQTTQIEFFQLYGLGGNDQLTGSSLDDYIDGGADDDLIEGGLGDDTLIGGFGLNTLSYANAIGPVNVDLWDGTVSGADGSDSINGFNVVWGSSNSDTFLHGNFPATVSAGLGDDLIQLMSVAGGVGTRSAGDEGNDTIAVFGGSDAIGEVDGGAETDTFDASGFAYFGMAIDFASGQVRNLLGGYLIGSINEIENVIGTTLADSITGDGEDNLLEGRGGDDTITGGLGIDTMRGEGGNDLLIWSDGDGTETIDGGADTDTFRANLADGSGDNVSVSETVGKVIERSNLAPLQLTLLGVENIELNGLGGDDTLRGHSLRDRIDGGADHDSLMGFGGNDTLIGGAGNDTLIGGRGVDSLVGDAGDDLAIWTNGDGSDSFDGGTQEDTLRATLTDGFGDDVSFDETSGLIFQRNNSGTFQIALTDVEVVEINALGGNDTVIGHSGRDSIDGGIGSDSISGGGGHDTLLGGSSSDTILGGAGNDLAIWNNGDGWDTFVGGDNNDTLRANLDAVNGDNVGFDETGGLTLRRFNLGNFRIELSEVEIVELNGLGGDDTLFGHAGIDVIDGGDNNDLIRGNGGADSLNGGDGDDTIFGGFGGANIDGGSGLRDVVDFSDAADSIDLNSLYSLTARIGSSGSNWDTIRNIEDIIGSDHNDTLRGDWRSNSIEGGQGDDLLSGDILSDSLAGTGVDTVRGGAGNDTIDVGPTTSVLNAGDVFDGGADVDTLLLADGYFYRGVPRDFRPVSLTDFELFELQQSSTVSAYTDRLIAQFNVNQFFNAGFTEIVGGARLNIKYAVELFADALATVDLGALTVTGFTDPADEISLIGDGDDEHLTGTDFNDTIRGNGGNDTLIGGLGDDWLDGGAGAGEVNVVDYSGSTGPITVTLDEYSVPGDGEVEGPDGTDTIENIDVLIATDFDDDIRKISSDVETVRGGEGDDHIAAVGVSTVYLTAGDAGNDTIYAVDGFYIGDVDGGADVDTFDVSRAEAAMRIDMAAQEHQLYQDIAQLLNFEHIIGTEYSDTIVGDAGDNDLEGRGGDDTFTGGSGADRFVYNLSSGGDDVITDFEVGRDKIHIDYFGAMPSVGERNGNALISLGGTMIELQGINRDQVSEDFFSYDIAQSGSVQVSHLETLVSLDRTFMDPVVFAKTTSTSGAAPVIVRISDIQNNQFSIALQEPNSDNGIHAFEEVSWLAIEAGQWELEDGTRIEVGNYDSDLMSTAGFEDVLFTEGMFNQTPAVLSQVQTDNDSDWVITRQRDANDDGVQITMQEEQALIAGSHGVESIGWMAMERASGTWNGRQYQSGATGDTVNHVGVTSSFADPFAEAPELLTSLSRYDGADPTYARADNVTGTGFDVFAQEETSADAEINHTPEDVDFLALAGSGLLSARKSQPVIAEYGTVSARHLTTIVNLENDFLNPVVLASVMTENEAEPVAVRISAVEGDYFELRLQEPSNTPSSHTPETVSWMVVEAGRWQLSDGTVFEAGMLESSKLSPQGVEQVSFGRGQFDTTPAILSQVQTLNGTDWVTTRQTNASTTGFELTMQEEENLLATPHASERIGWLAWESGDSAVQDELFDVGNTGRVVSNANHTETFSQSFASAPTVLTQLSTLFGQDPTSARTKSVTATDFTVAAEEETSFDPELSHTTEIVDFIALTGDGRIEGSAFAPVIAAIGQATLNDASGTISLGHDFINPVIFALPASQVGSQPAIVRITDVTSNAFTAYIQEPNNEDGTHIAETFSWMAIEAGTWMLEDGTRLAAGEMDTALLTSAGFESLTFGAAFDSAPVVMSQVQTNNGADYVVTRQDNITGTGMNIALQEEEALNGGGHAVETVGWFAIEGGNGSWNGNPFEARMLDDAVDEDFDTFQFTQSFGSAPNMLAGLASYNGEDPASLRYQNLTNTGVDLRVMEDTSLDAETLHIYEDAALFALEGSGLLTGFEWAI
ncbi:hypothetical protein VK792_14125 [Mesobacterium sp. TK19101]|uniref:Peptidase metallopeptidase domain-containing protein n=1 Tax=Mesobacterium hydrothermale TaxID=3111907 RepID=A0ABU6HIZ2_9RHOB|nr:hypothetical protein [Mesobacterium sp. TK19101]MEC3862425.1 hypothetical protein [Mesobacterium sp. TK19101]